MIQSQRRMIKQNMSYAQHFLMFTTVGPYEHAYRVLSVKLASQQSEIKFSLTGISHGPL